MIPDRLRSLSLSLIHICSGKLSGAEKTRLRQWGQEQKLPEDLGMIIRTNASGVAEEDLNTEFVRLMEQYTYCLLYTSRCV